MTDNRAMIRFPGALGAQPAGGPPEALAGVIRNELAKWPRLIREAGIRLD